MAKYFAVISTERGTQVSRLGHKKLETLIQTNSQRVEVLAQDETFDIYITGGRYSNSLELSGLFATVKNGKIYISDRLKDKIVFLNGRA